MRTLLLARNRIAAVQHTLPNAIPGLRNLVLAGNNLGELADLDVLGRFARLTHLVLVDNPVTKREVGFYRPPVIYMGLGGRVADCVGWETELSVLGPLAVSHGAVFGLPEGQGCRAAEGEGVVWDG